MGVNRKYTKVMRGSLIGGFFVAISGLAFFSAEHLVGEIIDKYRPKLENDISKKIGHPLIIGQYKGLKPWGIAFGPTKLLPGYKDQSTVNIGSLNIQLAPISSLLGRKPVLVFTGSNASFNLRRNINGDYWVLGDRDQANSPNLELRFRLDDSSRIFVQPSNIEINAIAQLDLNLKQSKAKAVFDLALPRNGSVKFKAKGNWTELDFQSKIDLKKFRLKSLEGVLPPKHKLKTRGQVDGSFQLDIDKGDINCNGNLVVSNFILMRGGFTNTLTFPKTSLICQNDLFSLPSTEWQYGLWTATVKGELPLKPTNDLGLGLSTLISFKEDPSTSMKLDAVLPLHLDKRTFKTGDLSADFKLDSFSLSNLIPVLDNSLAGNLSAKGTLSGPLSAITANFSFLLDNPQFSRFRLQEKWQGKFIGNEGGGGELLMNSAEAAVPARVFALFKNDWNLNNLTVSRLGGQIDVTQSSKGFKWNAKDFRLDRLEVAIPPEKSFKRIFGKLSGQGGFKFNPFYIDGKLIFGYPRLIGVKLREANLKGSYSQKNYYIDGDIFPLDSGQISINTEGRLGGPLSTRAKFKRVTPSWIVKSALQLPNLKVETPIPGGRAEALQGIKIQPKDGSLDDQLREWIRSVVAVSRNKKLQENRQIFNPDNLRGYIDGLIEIEGPEISNLKVDLSANGKLWTSNDENKDDSDIKYFTATLRGPLQVGQGDFSFENIPFSLLSLFIPAPSGLTGMFGFAGKYRLGNRYPEITADLTFNEVSLGSDELLLKRGIFSLSKSILSMDVNLQSSDSLESLTIAGEVPLASSLPINLRLESHGDGIRFLDEIFDNNITWNSGNADLRLLIRGTIENPQANGFLVLTDGEFVVKEQIINDINTTMVFDFNRVEVQNLNARIGNNGEIKGDGDISLVRTDQTEKNPLSLEITNFEIKSMFSDVQISSKLNIKGALISPLIGGSVNVEKGSISTERSSSSTGKNYLRRDISDGASEQKTVLLPEQKWNRKTPLVLFIRDENAPASQILKSTIPKGLSAISFDNLKINVGPDLRIVSPPIASFDVDGFLLLNGRFDQTIKAKGFIQLLNGQVNLFTTTFYLNRREPNVVVFVPSMGLMPYVDVKLTTRVPDAVRDPGNLSSSSDFVSNGSGAFGIGGSRFVKVDVTATGPADRLTENYQIRSTPPIPESELIGLIGGNSLTNLFEEGDSTLVADVLTRSLITPVLGNISGAFSDRLQIALYPAYVNGPEVDSDIGDSESSTSDDKGSGQLSSEQAWITEMGIDLTDRISFSVQATPNREDIPPQGNLAYQLNQNFGLIGSFDQNGNWQSQLEIFLRY